MEIEISTMPSPCDRSIFLPFSENFPPKTKVYSDWTGGGANNMANLEKDMGRLGSLGPTAMVGGTSESENTSEREFRS